MRRFLNAGSADIIVSVSASIVENKAYLSEIDGKIGDGDHGVNMAKGFGRCAERLNGTETLDQAMNLLSDILLTEIGGSMGPLYGSMFMDMAEMVEDAEYIDAPLFGQMLDAGIASISDIGSAKLGDKTMLDTFIPAARAFNEAVAQSKSFPQALASMQDAAERGRDSTIDLVAKVGRAARLGERSRGVLDAGATSCCIILAGLGQGVAPRLVD
ncbi:MAG: dihydroxyacetone kinase subunit L [Rhizobiales bacterium]|nr:dihydroxyacetone kinase subunit L [Hyphomicrobiales bacterium]